MSFDFTYPTPLPSTKGWGPGWPDCQTDKIVPHRVFAGGVHEDIVELVDLLVWEIERRGFRFQQPGCWGYACRGTKTSSASTTGTPSFHSWGLALDINAPQNPYGAAENDSDIATRNRWLVGFLADYGFFWLGPSIRDWMHFSFCGSPADAARMTEKARREIGAEMSYTDFKAGVQARIDDRPFQDEWDADKKFGWRMEDRLRRALVEPAPGPAPTPEPHTHPHVHTNAQSKTGADEAVI